MWNFVDDETALFTALERVKIEWPDDLHTPLSAELLVSRLADHDCVLAIVNTRRDAAEILGLGIPMFCRGVTPNSAFPSGPGEVGLPLAMGEVTIDAGDLVIGDRDGVVVVPQAQVEEVTDRLERVAAKEAEILVPTVTEELERVRVAPPGRVVTDSVFGAMDRAIRRMLPADPTQEAPAAAVSDIKV